MKMYGIFENFLFNFLTYLREIKCNYDYDAHEALFIP